MAKAATPRPTKAAAQEDKAKLSAERRSAATMEALSIPPLFSATTHLMSGDGTIRIAFGESAIGGVHSFHTAVVMTRAAAVKMAKSIDGIIEKWDAEAAADDAEDDES